MPRSVIAVLLCLFFVLPAYAMNISGNWEANVMGSRVVAKVHQEGSAVNGVAYVYSPVGKKNTYHFSGNFEGNRLFASHTNGHSFTGGLRPDGRLVGTLTTSRGHKLGINAVRP